MYDSVPSSTGAIPSQADTLPAPPRAGQLPRYLRDLRRDAAPLLSGGDRVPAGQPSLAPADLPTLAAYYRSAEPIAWEGSAVYPMYSEELTTAASSLTMTLLSADPPAGLSGMGMGLSVAEGYIGFGNRHLTGVDIWLDALEQGVTFTLTAESRGALFVLTPVWANSSGEPRSWSGNYGIVIERIGTGHTVLWCSMGEGPPHFTDLVVEVHSTPLDTPPRASISETHPIPAVTVARKTVPEVSIPGEACSRDRTGDAVPAFSGTTVLDLWEGQRLSTPVPVADDSTEFYGYPCSFADLFLFFPPFEPSGPEDTATRGGAGDDYGAAADPLLPYPADEDGDERGGSTPRHALLTDEDDCTGSHGWAVHPEETGLVPVVSIAELTDYGPEPPRSAAEPALSADPLPYREDARYTAEDDSPATGGHSILDTVADDSLTPLPCDPFTAGEAGPEHLFELGTAAYARGDDEQAGRWWEQAARAGHLGAVYDLGVLSLRRGDTDAAERWWRAAAGRRLIRAMAGLAQLLEERGAVAEARMWRTQAIAEQMIATATRSGGARRLTSAYR
ncbi:tetratricopeptide repeat protein [Nocardia sp. X0981]